jgi:hypothetical protein
LTNTEVSAGRLYWENEFSFFGEEHLQPHVLSEELCAAFRSLR